MPSTITHTYISLDTLKKVKLKPKKIIEERNNNGTFTSYFDFVKRTYKLGKDVTRSCNIRKVNGILEIVESGG